MVEKERQPGEAQSRASCCARTCVMKGVKVGSRSTLFLEMCQVSVTFQKMFLRNRGSLFLWKERWHSKRYLQPCQPHPVLHLTACIRVPLHVDKNAHSQTSPKPYRFSFSRSKCAKQAPPMGLTNTDVWEPHEFKDEPEIQVVCHRCHSHLSLKGSRGLCPWSKEVEGAGRLSTICDPGWILVQEKDIREATDDIWKMSED